MEFGGDRLALTRLANNSSAPHGGLVFLSFSSFFGTGGVGDGQAGNGDRLVAASGS